MEGVTCLHGVMASCLFPCGPFSLSPGCMTRRKEEGKPFPWWSLLLPSWMYGQEKGQPHLQCPMSPGLAASSLVIPSPLFLETVKREASFSAIPPFSDSPVARRKRESWKLVLEKFPPFSRLQLSTCEAGSVKVWSVSHHGLSTKPPFYDLWQSLVKIQDVIG